MTTPCCLTSLGVPLPFNDWRLVRGADLPPAFTGLLVVVAAAALALSVVGTLWGRPPPRSLRTVALLVSLRAGALALALAVALQPTLALRQIAHVPNHIAFLVDTSRSMAVRAPRGGASRTARAAALVAASAAVRARWERDGHLVDFYGFADGLQPATAASLAQPPAGEATRLGEALAEVRTRYAGRDLGAVVVVSDGIDTGRVGAGPLDAETRAALAALDAPVHTFEIGESDLRDLSVATVMADDFAFVRTPVTIEGIIRHHGLANRQVDVSLKQDGREIDVRSVALHENAPGGGDAGEEKLSFTWVPDHPGQYVFEMSTPVLGGEALANNNAQVFTIKVIRDRIRVLHVCGRPSWDERFLRSLLRRDPNVDLVSFFILRTETDEQPWDRNEMSLIPFPTMEIFDEQLRSFDLVVFQNFNYLPYGVEAFLPGIRDYVLGGGALAMIGGDLSFGSGGYGGTPLAEVLPVTLGPSSEASFSRDSYRPKLTPEGRQHPVTALSLEPAENERRFAKLPPLEGLNQVTELRPGATALLVHPSARTAAGKPAPVVAVTDAGQGRTLALMTDSAWRWGFVAAGEGDDGRAFQRFWDNAIRWLVRDPALSRLRVEPDRLEYHRGQAPSVRVRTLKPDYTPAGRVTVSLSLRPSDAPADATPLQHAETTTNDEGEAQVDLTAPPPGAYRLTGKATLDGRPVVEEKTLIVRVEGRELEDVVAREGVLREMAEVTQGRHQALVDGAADVDWDALRVREPREVRIGRQENVALWAHPLVLMAALGLLLGEWWLRRRAGYR